MNKNLVILSLPLLLAACATPVATLKHPGTGQVVTCGGGMGGSVAGGLIGHNIQKNNDQKCIANYKKQGFKVVK